MKKISLALGFAFLVIATVMLYLVKVGVSLRPAMYIKPSLMTDGVHTVARDVALRLFPDLNGNDYLVWGLSPSDGDGQTVFQLLKAEQERTSGKAISVLTVDSEATAAGLNQCATPCWIVRNLDQANELKPNSFITEKLQPLLANTGKKYFTLTVSSFHFGEPVPDECWAEKRLDFRCIQLVSVQAAEKSTAKARAKAQLSQSTQAAALDGKPAAASALESSSNRRYFFLNKYNEGDFFLFIEQSGGH